MNGDSDAADRCNGGPGADVEYSCVNIQRTRVHARKEHLTRAYQSSCYQSVSFVGVDAAVWLHEFENGAVGIIDNRTGSNVNINGTNKRDLILVIVTTIGSGGNGGDDCTCYAGNDDIDGELGNDEIYGGNGNDELKGGWGKLIRIFGSGAESHIDGDANDTLWWHW